MSEVEKLAKGLGHKKIYLTVHPENYQAISFYLNKGYVKRFIYKNEPWHGHMEKTLN